MTPGLATSSTFINQHFGVVSLCIFAVDRVVLADHDLTTYQGTEVIRGVCHVVEVTMTYKNLYT